VHYFPLFINIKKFKVLVVGGGEIAFDKVQKLLDFSNEVTILSKEYSLKIQNIIKKHNLKTLQKEYQLGDIDNFDIVIVAVDDINIQKNIYLESRKKRILCNCVDVIEYCDFIFGSYIKQDDLVISISTSGSSPAVAKHLKRFLQNSLPNSLNQFLTYMKSLRLNIPKSKERMKMFDQKAKEYFDNLN